MKTRKPLDHRFWSKVEKTDGCWFWRGSLKDNGYGQVFRVGGIVTAHRASWILHFGDIPSGVHVLHHCDVRHCVRPDHLFLGTRDDNMLDMRLKHRVAAGARHYRAKLTEAQVNEIRERVSRGEMQKTLAREFGVASSAICKIAHGIAWTHTAGFGNQAGASH